MSFFTSVPEPFTLPGSAGEFGRRTIAASDTSGFLDLQMARLTSGFPDRTEASTIVQWVSAEGSEIGPAYDILQGVGSSIETMQVTELDGGGWSVAATLRADPEEFPPRLAVQILAADGQPLGPPLLYTNDRADRYVPLDPATLRVTADPDVFATRGTGGIALWDVTARPDGTLVVAAPHLQDGAHQIIVQVYDTAGTPVGPRQTHSLDRAASNISVTTADSGDVLITWDDPVVGGELAIFSAEGTLTHHPLDTPIGGTTITHFVEGTEIAFAWQEFIPNTGGDTLGNLRLMMQTGSVDGFSAPMILSGYAVPGGFPDGFGFVPLGHDVFVGIQGGLYDGSDLTDIRATVVDADGWRYGSTVLFSVDEQAGSFAQGSATIVNGDLLVWTDTGIGRNGPHLFKTFELPEDMTGTEGDDTLVLSSAGFVRAGAGNDYVQGSAQDDVLDGGVGNDSLFGGRAMISCALAWKPGSRMAALARIWCIWTSLSGCIAVV